MATIFVARPEDPEPIEVNDFNLEWYKAQGYVQVATGPQGEQGVPGPTGPPALNEPQGSTRRSRNAMLSSAQVTVSFVGDSILEGNTAANPGVDDTATLVCNELSRRFGVNVVKNNVARSGHTAWRGLNDADRFAAAINANPAIVVIGFGHNDIRSDLTTPSFGYPRQSSRAVVESMVRRVIRRLPEADIILIGQNPYTAGSSSNPPLLALIDDYRAVAAHYNIPFVDTFQDFLDFGDYSSLMADGGHPNSAGHQVAADGILRYFRPDDNEVNTGQHRRALPAPLFASTLVTAFSESTSFGPNPRQPQFTTSGAGWAGSPLTTSSAGDFVRFLGWGPELFAYLDAGAGQGVVSVHIDGQLLYNNLDLASYSAGQRRFAFTGLSQGPHSVVVVLVSGSVTVRGVAHLQGPGRVIPMTSSDVSYTSGWTLATSGTGSSFFSTDRISGGVPGVDTITVRFSGTGLSTEAGLATSAAVRTITATIDGTAYAPVQWTNKPSGTLGYGGLDLVSGLPFGDYEAIISFAGTSAPIVAGFVAHGARSAP